MYPNFVKETEAEGNKAAHMSFTFGIKANQWGNTSRNLVTVWLQGFFLRMTGIRMIGEQTTFISSKE